MRQSEFAGLRWEDVDLMAGTALVRRVVYRLGEKIVEKEPKSATPGGRWPCRKRWCKSCESCGKGSEPSAEPWSPARLAHAAARPPAPTATSSIWCSA